jgi:hypothetical protein
MSGCFGPIWEETITETQGHPREVTEFMRWIAATMAGESLLFHPQVSSNDVAYLKRVTFVVERTDGVKFAEYKVSNPGMREVAVSWRGDGPKRSNRPSSLVLAEKEFWSPIRDLEVFYAVRGRFPLGYRIVVTVGEGWGLGGNRGNPGGNKTNLEDSK